MVKWSWDGRSNVAVKTATLGPRSGSNEAAHSARALPKFDDYSGSGFSRGHIVRAATASPTRSNGSDRFERFEANLIRNGGSAHVVQGRTSDSVYKVVALLPHGATKNDVTRHTQVFAVKMPVGHQLGAHEPLSKYLVSPSEIERATGRPLFRGVPKDVADSLRSRKPTEMIAAPSFPERKR